MRRVKKSLLLSSLMICAGDLVVSTAVNAQIDEIVVTARKREESVQDVPVAISAFTGNFLRQNAVNSIEDLGSIVPNFISGQSQLSAGGAIYLRGVGSATGNGLIDQSVAINLDGVSIAQASLMFSGQYDVETLEVLRGPQVLFFGKNSPGGVVGFKSRDPGDEFELELSSGYEIEAEEKYGSIILSGPLGDRVGARVFARYADQEGFYNVTDIDAPVVSGLGPALPSSADSLPDASDIFVRGTLTANPVDALDLRAKFTFSDRDIDSYPIGWQRSFCPLGSPNFLGTPLSIVAPQIDIDDCKFDRNIYTGDQSAAALAAFDIAEADADGFRRAKIILGSIEGNYAWDNGLTLTSITGVYNVDDDVNQEQSALPTSALPTSTSYKTNIITEELRISSDWDFPLNFMFGGLYEHRTTSTVSRIPAIGRINGTNEQEQSAYSLFGQAVWDITDQVELSMGARYTHEEKSVDVFRNYVRQTFTVPGADEISFNNLSPEVSLSYSPTDDFLIYAAYKQGYKSGGFDEGALNAVLLNEAATYDDEDVEGYEIGVKATLFDGSLQVNANAFSYDYSNLQVTSFDSVAIVVTTVNAAGADVDGLEMDFMYQVPMIEGLSIRGAGSVLDAKYKQFISNCFTGQRPDQGCNVDVIPGGAFEGLDLSGVEIQRAPEYTASLGVNYQMPLGNNFILGLSADGQYSDSYDTQQQRSPGTRQPSYYKANTSVSLYDADGAWELSFIGRNLNNEILRTVGQNVPLSGSGTGTPGAVNADSLNLFAERGRELIFQFRVRPAELFN